MSLRSTIARPTLTPALNVRSTTPPVLTLRSFVRTNAPPLPGLTCWNSTTWNSVPSSSSGHAVLQVVRGHAHSTHQLLGGSRDLAAAVRGHLDHVLDPDASEAGNVHAGLDRDDHPSTSSRPRPIAATAPRGSPARRRDRGRAGTRRRARRRRSPNARRRRPPSSRRRHGRRRSRRAAPPRPGRGSRAAAGSGSPNATVRVMSEWYPSASAPKSSLTRSPRDELPVRQVVVGFRRVVAERHDRVERAILGAGVDHRPLEDLGEHCARVTPARRPPPRTTVSNARSAKPCARSIAAISSASLTRAQALDLRTDRHELQALRPIRELFPRLVGERRAARTPRAWRRAFGTRRRGARVVLPVDGPRQVGHLVAGLRRVPAVGQEHRRRVRRDHELRVRPREAGQVAHVGQARDDQRLELRLRRGVRRAARASARDPRQRLQRDDGTHRRRRRRSSPGTPARSPSAGGTPRARRCSSCGPRSPGGRTPRRRRGARRK